MYLLTWLLLSVLVLWAFERFYLRGEKLGEYPPPSDPGTLEIFTRPGGPGPAHLEVIQAVNELTTKISISIRKNDLATARSVVDSLSVGREYVSQFIPVDAGGVPAEWVIAPGADKKRRLLYIHGGAFMMGSPKSHRTITSKFSEVSSCSVLAIDYRLLPRYGHMDCVEDCRTAYQWIIENGPEEAGAVRELYVAGDSAGGNLTLSLAAWVRDNGLRAPEGLVALSPLTDNTFSGASIRDNADSEIMLKPVSRILSRIPRFIKTWWIVLAHRIRPGNPVASPLLGNLSDLPPTLVQVSDAEILLDDARRYVFKAHASGSPAKLQIWSDMVHVWQLFDPQLPQAAEAWVEIGKFLDGRHHNAPLTESSAES